LLLACLAYLSVALPGSTLGPLWPSMRLSLGQPIGALGILLVPGIAASVVSSAVTGRLRVPTGPLVAGATLLIAPALAAEALAPSMWVMIVGTVVSSDRWPSVSARPASWPRRSLACRWALR
jgi:hypothetical protein